MKKIQRDRALSALLDRLESRDFDRRENALFELAVMLRRANQRAGGADPLGGAELPRELARIRLTPEEQGNIVDRLLQLIVKRPESRGSAFWVLCEAAPVACWEPVLHLLKACGDELEEEAAYQACRALQIWLESGELTDELVQRGLAACNPRALLLRWARTSDRRLKRAAQGLTRSLPAPAE